MEEFCPGKFDEKIVFITVFVVSQLVQLGLTGTVCKENFSFYKK